MMNKNYLYKSLLAVIVYLGLLSLFMIIVLLVQLGIGAITGLSFNQSVNRYIFDYGMIDKTFLGAVVSLFAMNGILKKLDIRITSKEKLSAYIVFVLVMLVLLLTFLGVLNFSLC